jgi:hypothetical protein
MKPTWKSKRCIGRVKQVEESEAIEQTKLELVAAYRAAATKHCCVQVHHGGSPYTQQSSTDMIQSATLDCFRQAYTACGARDSRGIPSDRDILVPWATAMQRSESTILAAQKSQTWTHERKPWKICEHALLQLTCNTKYLGIIPHEKIHKVATWRSSHQITENLY